MAKKTVKVTVSKEVASELEVPQLQVALNAIAGHFSTKELAAIAQKLKNPLVLMKIRSMV